MITLQIKYLSQTGHKPRRWKVFSNTNTPPLTVCADTYSYTGAAERFIEENFPDCTIRAFGQLPTGDKDNVALASYDEEKRV